MLNHIKLPLWAKDEASFRAVMIQFGLAKMVDGKIEWDRDLNGQPTPDGESWQPVPIPDTSSPFLKDEDGNDTTQHSAMLPGNYYNLQANYRKPRGDYVSLAERLYRVIDTTTGADVLDEDGNHVIYPQYETVQDEDGNDVEQLKNIARRCRIPTMVRLAGGAIVSERGFDTDAKAPKHLDVVDGEGAVIFRVFDPDDIATPANTF